MPFKKKENKRQKKLLVFQQQGEKKGKKVVQEVCISFSQRLIKRNTSQVRRHHFLAEIKTVSFSALKNPPPTSFISQQQWSRSLIYTTYT